MHTQAFSRIIYMLYPLVRSNDQLDCHDPLFSETALKKFFHDHTYSLCAANNTSSMAFLRGEEPMIGDAAPFACSAKFTGDGVSLWQCAGSNVRFSSSASASSPDFEVDAWCPGLKSREHQMPPIMQSAFTRIKQIRVHDGVGEAGESAEASCEDGDAEVLEGVTLVLVGVDWWNPSCSTHETLAAWITVSVLHSVNVSQVVLLSDKRKNGSPLLGVYQRLFAQRLIFPAADGKAYCARHALLPVPAGVSPVEARLMSSECVPLPLFQRYTDAFLRAFPRGQRREPDARNVRALILDRRDHRVAVQRRVMTNIEEVASSLNKRFRNVTFEIYRPTDFTADKQVETIRNSDILIAPHGASLNHMIELPYCGGLVELGDNGDRRFYNMAKILGPDRILLQYVSVPGLNWGTPFFNATLDRVIAAVGQVLELRPACLAEPRHAHRSDNVTQAGSTFRASRAKFSKHQRFGARLQPV